MKKKKFCMIIILLVVVGILIFAIGKVNNKANEKISNTYETGNTTENISISANKNNGVIRKGQEEVNADTNNIVEITDNYFIEQTNDVYLNLKDYIGKTIKIEGLIYAYEDDNGDICYAVVRNTPGCCGADGLAGLDIRYNGEYPEENTWVEVIGVVGTDNVYGSDIPAIQVASLKETETGVTFVSN